jgi:hypothetical protein
VKNLVGYQIEILRYAQNDKNGLLFADWYQSVIRRFGSIGEAGRSGLTL